MPSHYMLDTDICSYLMRENPLSLLAKFKEHQERTSISCITYAELSFGAEKKGSDRLRAQITRFASMTGVVDWDAEAALQYASLRVALTKAGKPIDNMDLMIAASALSKKYILVSNNNKHFQHIPGLEFEIWI
ncbi:hypothetical protein AGMMS49957_15610 [Synergistales bacterium]|nr:hypothetical protein AGMMS49957_15610 [Synergistales bacterium]